MLYQKLDQTGLEQNIAWYSGSKYYVKFKHFLELTNEFLEVWIEFESDICRFKKEFHIV